MKLRADSEGHRALPKDVSIARRGLCRAARAAPPRGWDASTGDSINGSSPKGFFQRVAAGEAPGGLEGSLEASEVGFQVSHGRKQSLADKGPVGGVPTKGVGTGEESSEMRNKGRKNHRGSRPAMLGRHRWPLKGREGLMRAGRMKGWGTNNGVSIRALSWGQWGP